MDSSWFNPSGSLFPSQLRLGAMLTDKQNSTLQPAAPSAPSAFRGKMLSHAVRRHRGIHDSSFIFNSASSCLLPRPSRPGSHGAAAMFFPCSRYTNPVMFTVRWYQQVVGRVLSVFGPTLKNRPELGSELHVFTS